MPPIDHLNPPPNPFWDFVADMQGHPLFAAYAPQHRPHQPRDAEPTAAGSSSNNAQPQQPTAEDPPEVDPATLQEQTQERREHTCRGRRRCGSGSDEEGERRRGCGGRRGGGRHGRRGWGGSDPFDNAGFPGFPFAGLGGGPPFWARGPHPPAAPPGFGLDAHGPGHHGPGHHGPGPHGPGPHPRGGPHRRGGSPHHPWGPHRRGHGHGPRGPSPPPGASGFDLGQFLNDLGSRIGMDLSGAAQNLGLDRLMPSNTNAEVDFEPKVDIFDRSQEYMVHVSLPGAKKSDIGVEWDGEHSVLRVTGVVHRPEVNEEMLAQLVVDGRKRETGVFEKTIRLGTRRDPAVINVAGIKAKMVDGVLVITVPKSEKQHEKRDVPIAKSLTPSPVRDVRDNEKDMLLDTDHEMHEADEPTGEINLVDFTKDDLPETSKGKQAEHEADRKSRESSATVEAEPEQLPAYNPVEHHDGSDWEHFGSEDEGEYVKISVD